MESSVVASAQTTNTVSSLIDVSLDSMEQDLSVVETQLTGLAVGDRVEQIKDSVSDAKKLTESTLAMLKDILGETDAYVTAAVKSYDQLETDAKTLTKDSVATAKSLKQLKKTLQKDISGCKSSIRQIRQNFQYQINPNLSKTILDIENSLISTGSLLRNVENSFGDIGTALEAYQTTLDGGTDKITATKDAVALLQEQIGSMIQVLGALADNEQYNEVIGMLESDPQLIASFVSSPVSMETEALYPIATYGSAMAPFYTVLAIWVGALILVALIHVQVRREEELCDVKPWQAYFGRYLTFFLIGQVQTAFIVLGDLFYVEIQCVHPVLFWLAAAASSFVFTLLIYSLTVAMGNVGEAIAVIVMVIQVAGAGGTFPIEVLPEVYRNVYRFLPFTYCMNAMRECVGGIYELDYVKDLRALGVYVLISLLIGLVLAIPLRRLNQKIEKSKEKSRVMI
jgi:putative membrane protein